MLQYSVKLDKGDYVIRMHIRDDKKDYLDKLLDIPMLLNQKLPNTITLDVHSSHSQAVIGGKKSGGMGLALASVTVPFYIAPLTSDKYVDYYKKGGISLQSGVISKKTKYFRKL